MKGSENGAALVLRNIIFIGFGVQMILGIVWMCNAFFGLTFGEGIVCVGQILAAALVTYFALPVRTPGESRALLLFQTAGILTFPMIAQCLVRPEKRLIPALFLLAALGLLRRLGKSGKIPALFLLLAGLGLLMNLAVQGPIHPTGRLAGRIAWTTLLKDCNHLPDEIEDAIDLDALSESMVEPGGMEEIFIPSLKATFGEEEGIRVLKDIMKIAWRIHKKRILKEIIWDEAGYLAPPLVVPMQLYGKGYESYTGGNYREFLLVNAYLGKCYADYGLWWFATALFLTLVSFMVRLSGKSRMNLGSRGIWVYEAVSVFFLATWFAMSGAGKMDYKNTLFILFVWMLLLSGEVRCADAAE